MHLLPSCDGFEVWINASLWSSAAMNAGVVFIFCSCCSLKARVFIVSFFTFPSKLSSAS